MGGCTRRWKVFIALDVATTKVTKGVIYLA